MRSGGVFVNDGNEEMAKRERSLKDFVHPPFIVYICMHIN